jgi:hypothetical protein
MKKFPIPIPTRSLPEEPVQIDMPDEPGRKIS